MLGAFLCIVLGAQTFLQGVKLRMGFRDYGVCLLSHSGDITEESAKSPFPAVYEDRLAACDPHTWSCGFSLSASNC